MIAATAWTEEDASSGSGSWDAENATLSLAAAVADSGGSESDDSMHARVIDNWQDLHYWILFSFLVWPSIGTLGLAGYRFATDNCTVTPFVLKMLALFQLPLIVGIAMASYIAEKQGDGEGVSLAIGLAVADASLLFIIYLVVSYGASGYTLSKPARIMTAVVLVAAIAIGIWLGLQLDGVQMFWSVSVAWGAIIGVVGLMSAQLYHAGSQKTRGTVCYVHFSPDVLPAFMYDASEGKLVSLTGAIVLRYCVGFGIIAWALAATMFVTPSWIGSFVMALEVVEMACFTLAARHSTMRFGRALTVLRSRMGKDELLNIVDEAREAARSEQEQVLQDIILAGSFEHIAYPKLEDVMVDAAGEPLTGGDIVSALAARTVGPSDEDLAEAEARLWTSTSVVTTGVFVQDLLLLDQRTALFNHLQIRYAALTRMQIEHAVAGDATGSDLTALENFSATEQIEVDHADERHAPHNVDVAPGNGSLKVSWSHPETLRVSTPSLVSKWVVEITPGWHSQSVDFAASDSGAGCFCEHLTNGVDYSVVVSLVYADGHYDRAPPVVATPVKPSLPQPVDLTIDQLAGPSTLGISWRIPPTDFVVLRFRVTAHPGAATQHVTSTKRRAVFTAMQGIRLGVEYRFSVTAIGYGDVLSTTAKTTVGFVAQASIGTEEMAAAAETEGRLEAQEKAARLAAGTAFGTWVKEAKQLQSCVKEATQRNLNWFSAAKHNNIDAAKRLLALDKKVVDTRDVASRTALHIVAANVTGDEDAVAEMVDLLLSKGADASAVDLHGQNPAHIAALSGNSFLVSKFDGTVLVSEDYFGRSPKALALINGHTACADLLPGDNCVQGHIWRGNKTLYGMFTDAFEKDTDLEGGLSEPSIIDLSGVLKRAIAHDLSLSIEKIMSFNGTKNLSKFEQSIARCLSNQVEMAQADQKFPLYGREELLQLAQMLALMEDAAVATYKDDPLQLRADVVAKCKAFSADSPLASRMIVICGGWSTPSGGHAIMYIIEATSASTISWTTSNTGQGVGHHPASGTVTGTMSGTEGDHGDASRTGQFGSVTSARIDNIDLAKVDDLWCCALMRQQNTASDNNNDGVYYDVLLPELLLAPLETAKTADQKTDGDYAKLQRAGTCYYKCVGKYTRNLVPQLDLQGWF